MQFLYGTLAKFSVKKPMVKKKKKRILMLYDFPIMGGGSGTYVKYLALHLQASGKYEVAIAAPEKNPVAPTIKTYNLKLPQVPVFIGRPGLEKSKKYSDLSSQEISELYDEFIKETLTIVKDFKPDIIHVHHAMINLWVARFIRSVDNIKFIITSHGSDLITIAQDRRYFRMTRDALRAASMITVVSGDTRSRLLKMFGKDLASKVRTVPGGVSVNLFPLKKTKEELDALKKELKVGDRPIVLFTGRLITEKGVHYLIKAAARINGFVVIVGDGPQKETLKKLIQVNKLTNVKLLSHIDHEALVNLYYASEVFVSPVVIDEGLGLTIIEAMAASKPVVVTRKGGIPTAVKDGFNGLFVRTHNATDIAEKVNKLLSDLTVAKKMGENGREIVKKRFTWEMIAKKFDVIYSKI